jgi:hypothetical protein
VEFTNEHGIVTAEMSVSSASDCQGVRQQLVENCTTNNDNAPHQL